jgi:hypothetical protein
VTTPTPQDEPLRELADVADELLGQAAALRRRWQELGDALGVDLETGEVDGGSTAEAPAETDEEVFDAVARAGYGPADEEPDPIRVVAFDMMLSGRTRKEVKEYIRASFGQDADLGIVDELFDTR